jgi:hypothetical protein
LGRRQLAGGLKAGWTYFFDSFATVLRFILASLF